MPSLIEVKHLKEYFEVSAGTNHAVDDMPFSIEKGEILGVVGESRCGKSTPGHTPIYLQEVTEGEILLNGMDITHVRRGELRTVREQMQIVFRDPYLGPSPWMRIEFTIMESLKHSGRLCPRSELQDEASHLMDLVEVDERLRRSYPRKLDGGRHQKVGIAWTLMLNPEFVVCDEPVSALDVSIQVQVLDLLMDLQEKSDTAYMSVAHDLSVVRRISDNIYVTCLGRLVERAPSAELFAYTSHPYTKALLSTILFIDILRPMRQLPLKGKIILPINPESGCRFYSRCSYATEACKQPQGLTEVSGRHFASCCRVSEIGG